MLSRQLVSLALGAFFLAVAPAAVHAQKAAKPCVDTIHVIKGCGACEAMQEWLKKAGVKLELTKTSATHYEMYPTVIYTDKKSDHGQRMYEQKVVIPKKICVIINNSGTE